MADNSIPVDVTNQTTPTPAMGKEITADYVMEQYQRGTLAMRASQYDYVKNTAFLHGQQWLQYDYLANVWTAIPLNANSTRIRATMNVLRSSLQRITSKLLSREMVYEVYPADSDSASVRGAQLGEAIAYDLHCNHDWEKLREDAAIGAFIGGTSILSIDWDAKAGATIGNLPITGEAFGTGELIENCLSVVEATWEPGSKIANRGYWWMRAQALPPADVQQRYGLPDLPDADVKGLSMPLTVLLAQQNVGQQQPYLTMVVTYYERPNPLRPEGAICTVINGRVVGKVVPWYFPFKHKLNFEVIRESVTPGKSTGDTVFSDACRLQVAYNDMWSNFLEHNRNAGNARLLVPEGSLDGVEDISDIPGEIIPYNEIAGKPSYLEAPDMPTWQLQALDRMRAQIDDVLGIGPVSRGEAPGALESGIAVGILLEEDNTPTGRLAREIALAFENLATMALQIYAANVKETRKATINKSAHPESIEWTGQSLSGQTKATVPLDAIMPRSHAADLAAAQYLWTNHIITDPRDFVRTAQQPGYKSLLNVIDVDADKAERENHLMSLGNTCIPADFDDHRRHIDMHNRFRKSTRYESIPDMWRSIVDDHILAHERLAAEQMGQQEAKLGVSPNLANVPTAGAEEPILPIPPQASPQLQANPQLQPGTLNNQANVPLQ